MFLNYVTKITQVINNTAKYYFQTAHYNEVEIRI